MPITFRCDCGHSLEAPDSQVGSHVQCPRCGVPALVPDQAVDPLGFSSDIELPPAATTPADKSELEKPPAKTESEEPTWVIVGGIFSIIFLAYTFWPSGGDDSDPKTESTSSPSGYTSPATDNEPTELSQEIDAVIMAKQFVKQQLKYPHDASFPWFGTEAKRSGDSWIVNGKVKAKNSFGAELTHEFLVVVKHVHGDTWKCESIIIE